MRVAGAPPGPLPAVGTQDVASRRQDKAGAFSPQRAPRFLLSIPPMLPAPDWDPLSCSGPPLPVQPR